MALWDTPLPSVMPPLGRDELASRINAALADNNVQGISAEDIRSRMLELLDSISGLAEDGGVINLLDTSLRFDDEDADQDDYFTDLIHDAALNGKRIFCHRNKTLWLKEPRPFPEGSVFLDFAPGFLIKGQADGTGTILQLDGSTTRGSFYARNLAIDNSLRSFVGAEASGTALTLRNFDHFELFGYRAMGGVDLSDVNPDHGDSGITINSCRQGRLWFPHIIGQPDLAIYITGGASTDPADDRGDIEIYAPYIENCAGAIANKRQGHRVSVFGGTVINCRTGISATEVSTVPPGRELTVVGTRFKRVESRCIRAQGDCKLTALGIDIEDWGYNPVTNVAAVGFDYAVHIEGPSYATVDASFRLRDWADTGGLMPVRLERFTETSTSIVYNPVGCSIEATIDGVANAIEETSTGITGNIYDLMLDSAVTINPVIYAPGSTSQLIENTIAGQRVERRAGSVFEMDRLTTPGAVVQFRQDNVVQGAVLTTAAGSVIFDGAARPPAYTAATLPTATDRAIIYVSDGNAGQPCLAVGRSGSWYRIPLGAVI